MIPFFSFTTISLGPLTIQVWGLCVALGIALALWFSKYASARRNLQPELVLDISLPVLIGAFVGARLGHIVFYDLGFYLEHPREIIAIWHGGFSSLGGFIGAACGAALALKRRKMSFNAFLPYLDVGLVSLWLGWGIGRIGCFLIHDHPGTLSHFVLAVRFPDGPRHDLGLYESLLGFALFAVFWALFPRFAAKRAGLVAAASILTYATLRFGLDFLRVVDARYASLTPAQWGMAAVIVALTGSLIFGKKQGLHSAAMPQKPE